MCTAVSYKNADAYFGRNLDLERGYGENVVIAPRRFPFHLRHEKTLSVHYAMIGMATVADGFPLYYDATNEMGLSMAGLNFPENAVYYVFDSKKDNIAPFELIPWILGQCACVKEAKQLLGNMNLVNINFSHQFPVSPMHWMISDKQSSIVIESLSSGIQVYDNPFEILTNNPPFDYHRMNMNNYMGLQVGPADNHFGDEMSLHNYSLGMGAMGLPGDFSSASRFVRAFFVKENSVADKTEKDSVHQFFHILNSVSMPKGCVWTKNGYEYTRYSSCCNATRGIYYYTTYNQLGITAVSMQDVDLDQAILCQYEVCGM